MRALGWIWLFAAVVVYMIIAGVGVVGLWFATRARRLDARLDAWRYELQRDDGRVSVVADKIAANVRRGATSGAVGYDHLNVRDMERLARAIDNLGCYAKVWTRHADWSRRDRHPTGERLHLAAFPPADRDAWSDAIANLDGETER